jgi:hypothetical protein
MEAWRKRIEDARELLFDDVEEDHLMETLMLDLGNEEELYVPRVSGGSCLGKSANIERYRHEIHQRMM